MEVMKPKFSIVIPTYNRSGELEKVLRCLQSQTYDDFEVLICDDGSTDNSREVASTFESSLDINYLYQENSGGPAGPRNMGISASKNEWVCLLDSDDLWTINKLEVLARHINESDRKIFCHPVKVIDENDRGDAEIGKYKRQVFLNDFETLLYCGNTIVTSSVCVHTSLLTPDVLFKTDKYLQAVEDYVFLLEITSKNNRVTCVPETLGYYRVHSGNISYDLQSQVGKLRMYFDSKPFPNIDYAKVESWLKYMSAGDASWSRSKRAGTFFKIAFLRRTTLRIRLRAFIKLVLGKR